MRGILVTTAGEVSIWSGNFREAVAVVAPDSGIVQYLPTYGGEEANGLDLLTDEEGLMVDQPKPNALATLLAGYHTVGQFIVGDVLVLSTKDAADDEDWGVDPDLEVKVLRMIALRLKEAMLA